MLKGAAELTRAQVEERCARMAGWLADEPVRPIVVALSDDAECLATTLACMRLARTPMLLSPEASAAEVVDLVADAGLAILDRELDWELPCRTVRTSPPGSLFQRLLGRRRPDGWPNLLPAPGSLPDWPDGPAVILHTSGSTGRSKRIVLHRRHLVAEADKLADVLGIDAGDRLLTVAPMNHVDGITSGFLALHREVTLLRTGPFRIQELHALTDAVVKHEATHFIGPPTVLALLLRLEPDLRAWREVTVVSTAAPLAPGLADRFRDASGADVIDMFGTTETGNVLFDGVARGCEAEVRDGELFVRGPTVVTDDWYGTGDLVEDVGGRLRIVGRSKRVIITGGRNVHPEEIDAVLLDHPDVLEAVTLGVDDDVWGERITTWVRTRSPIPSAVLIAFVTGRVAQWKVPRALYVVDDLPRTATGKVDPSKLVEPGQQVEGDVEERVLQLAATAFRRPLDELRAERTTPSRQVRGWDSLAHLAFVVALEEAFDVSLSPNDIVRLDTLARAVERVR